MARHREAKKNINGILLLDKPLGISSNKALQSVKTLYGARKAGHTGSLDPLASGMLPLCFGEATKFSQYLLDANKCYRVTGRLGIKTTTADREGEIIKQVDDFSLDLAQLEKVLTQFRGEIEQVPSMYSALKHNGTPLYKLARQGIEVERPARKVTIFELKLLDFDGASFSLEVKCSKGTYIRNLVEDIGDELNLGAHVSELRRLYTDPYIDYPMVTMDSLAQLAQEKEMDKMMALILPIESILINYPTLSLDESLAYFIRNGQSILHSGAPEHGYVRLLNQDEKLLGIGEVTEDGRVAPRRLMTKQIA